MYKHIMLIATDRIESQMSTTKPSMEGMQNEHTEA